MDPSGLDRFLTWLWVPDPDTAFEGVKKLSPGHVLAIARDGRRRRGRIGTSSTRLRRASMSVSSVQRSKPLWDGN